MYRTNKTIASRIFVTVTLLIMANIFMFGVVFMVFGNQYFQSERLKDLSICVNSAEKNIMEGQFRYVGKLQNIVPLTENLQLIADTSQSVILIADKDGEIVAATSDKSKKVIGQKLPQPAIDGAKLTKGEVNATDIFTKNYGAKYYAVGKALFDEDGDIKGYIFACCDTGSITLFTNAIMSMFLLSASIMILISSVVSLMITSHMTTPLRNITEAARRFSQGDLSVRVKVEGDDEVAHLAATFNSMAEFADKNETSRSNFVANIAHELRTPMTSIKGFVDGIIDGTIPPDRQDSYLKIVSSEVGRLARLTNSMLDISKLDSGEFVMNVSKYNIWDTISDVAFAFESRIEEANIQVKGFEPTRMIVSADKDIIHQVVYNIVDNALKFTPNGGYISFNVSEDKPGGYTTVKIRNSGEGISKEAIPYIFERFYKTDASRSVHIKGAGIGMYIAKTLVNRSGGEIHVESEVGEYTEFIFTLPTAAEDKPALPKKQPEAKKGPRLNKNGKVK